MMSSSRMTRYSVPSIFAAEPEYLPNRMRSPILTSSGRILPSSRILPLPTAITLPWSGFSAALSGMTMPPADLLSPSMRSTTTRSWRGRIFIMMWILRVGAPQLAAAVRRRRCARHRLGGLLSADAYGEAQSLFLELRRNVRQIEADILQILRLQGCDGKVHVDRLGRILAGVEAVGRSVRRSHFYRRFSPVLLELDGVPAGVDVHDLGVDKTDGLVGGGVLQNELSGELRRRSDAARAF